MNAAGKRPSAKAAIGRLESPLLHADYGILRPGVGETAVRDRHPPLRQRVPDHEKIVRRRELVRCPAVEEALREVDQPGRLVAGLRAYFHTDVIGEQNIDLIEVQVVVRVARGLRRDDQRRLTGWSNSRCCSNGCCESPIP